MPSAYNAGMLYDRIDHVILGVDSLERAAEPFARLGLTLTPVTRHQGRGTENRAIFTGGPASEFYVELLAIADEADGRRVLGDAFVEACAQNRGLRGAVLSVPSMSEALTALAAHGLDRSAAEVFATDGRKVCDAAEVGEAEQAVADLRLIHYPEPGPERHTRHQADGLLDHTFPLKRLDHLAAVAPDLETATRFWTDTLGVPVAGEVRSPTTIIRQMRVGDAILELLGPATPDSPIATRPPGLISMAAFEVPDLDAAVAQARAAGFTPSEPATGILPGTRTATIPPTELAGMTLQLLQYV
jgi:catechol 2,3-dioxygenase-like lactoylglutathione lyase family enzyme